MARWAKPKERPTPDLVALRIGDRLFPVPLDLTIGEGRQIKRISGLTISEFAQQVERDPTDPDITTALAWLVMHRESPATTVADVEALLYSEIGVE